MFCVGDGDAGPLTKRSRQMGTEESVSSDNNDTQRSRAITHDSDDTR